MSCAPHFFKITHIMVHLRCIYFKKRPIENINTLHAQETASHYCAGCAHICEPAINNQVPISDVVRYLMYNRCYGEPDRAKSAFKRMPSKARKILVDMDYKEAEQKCPQRMQIGRLMHEAAVELA